MTTASAPLASTASVASHAHDRRIDRLEQVRKEIAAGHLSDWDSRRDKQVCCLVLAMTWLSVGRQVVLPVGLLIALGMLVPGVSGWSLWRRVRVTGRRSLYLLGAALLALVVGGLRLNVFDPDGSVFSVVEWSGFSF